MIIKLLDQTQPDYDVLGTSHEFPLKVLTSGTSREPSGDSQKTKKRFGDLMKKELFRCNSSSFTHLSLFFYWKNKYLKVLNWDVHGISTKTSCRTSRRTNVGCSGDFQDLGHTCFLNSSQEHVKLTFDRLLKKNSVNSMAIKK